MSGPFVYAQSSRTFVDDHMAAWALDLMADSASDAVAKNPSLLCRVRETFLDKSSSIRNWLCAVIHATLALNEVRGARLLDGRNPIVDVDGTYDRSHPVLGYTRRSVMDLVSHNGWYPYMDWAGAEIGWPPAFPGEMVLHGTQGPIDVRMFERSFTTGTTVRIDDDDLDQHPFACESPGDHTLRVERIRLKQLPWRSVESLSACHSVLDPEARVQVDEVKLQGSKWLER